jgi:FdhD protein
MDSEQDAVRLPNPDTANMSARERLARWVGVEREWAYDDLAVEEPLQIRLAGEDVAVTMRTPGHDVELALGFLFAEGIVSGRGDVESVGYCLGEDGAPAPNVVNVLPTNRGLLSPGGWGRNFISSSSCGLCGKTSIDQVITARTPRVPGANGDLRVHLPVLYSLVEKMRAGQHTFGTTGGIHAAGLFNLDGDLLLLREDVGRHNAVDKVVGHALLNDLLPLDRHILVVSSRASFEIVQKAVAAGVKVLAVVSAPSSLAVDLAREAGITLVAFLREQRLNVYAGEDRVIAE